LDDRRGTNPSGQVRLLLAVQLETLAENHPLNVGFGAVNYTAHPTIVAASLADDTDFPLKNAALASRTGGEFGPFNFPRATIPMHTAPVFAVLVIAWDQVV
jgi:hypothetical protein